MASKADVKTDVKNTMFQKKPEVRLYSNQLVGVYNSSLENTLRSVHDRGRIMTLPELIARRVDSKFTDPIWNEYLVSGSELHIHRLGENTYLPVVLHGAGYFENESNLHEALNDGSKKLINGSGVVPQGFLENLLNLPSVSSIDSVKVLSIQDIKRGTPIEGLDGVEPKHSFVKPYAIILDQFNSQVFEEEGATKTKFLLDLEENLFLACAGNRRLADSYQARLNEKIKLMYSSPEFNPKVPGRVIVHPRLRHPFITGYFIDKQPDGSMSLRQLPSHARMLYLAPQSIDATVELGHAARAVPIREEIALKDAESAIDYRAASIGSVGIPENYYSPHPLELMELALNFMPGWKLSVLIDRLGDDFKNLKRSPTHDELIKKATSLIPESKEIFALFEKVSNNLYIARKSYPRDIPQEEVVRIKSYLDRVMKSEKKPDEKK